MSGPPDVKMIADYACGTGENPLWHPDEKRLYWTDISTGRLFWYDPQTGHHQQCYDGPWVGGFTIQTDGLLCLFMDKGAILTWSDGFVDTIVPEIHEEVQSRFNDVIADPEGRVFGGTMATDERPGRLYRIDPDGSYEIVLDDCGGPNGMGFTPDLTKMYFTDSVDRTIWLFDYDRSSGSLSNRREFASITPEEGSPDGMTVDAEGCVWSARWGGGCVARYDADGELMQTLQIPADPVSSVIFGGEDLRDLYVTTAGGSNRDAGSHDGALFRLRPGGTGVPEFRSRIRLT